MNHKQKVKFFERYLRKEMKKEEIVPLLNYQVDGILRTRVLRNAAIAANKPPKIYLNAAMENDAWIEAIENMGLG